MRKHFCDYRKSHLFFFLGIIFQLTVNVEEKRNTVNHSAGSEWVCGKIHLCPSTMLVWNILHLLIHQAFSAIVSLSGPTNVN